jgi:sugar/nucleoside kinase (ribokinase family)
MSKERLDIVGIGNAMVDVLAKTTDDFLVTEGIRKGGMTLIDADQAEALYAKMGPGTEMAGGSVSNSIAAFAMLGGRAGFIGKVANDQLGDVVRHDMKASGVEFTTSPLVGGAPTARCMILITPDGQRTMSTYLGACVHITSADLDHDMLKNASMTYLEGYLFDKPSAQQTFRDACDIAHAAGKKVALSLSDSFCVERHREAFMDLIKTRVDILFANETEILSLFQVKDFGEAAQMARDVCQTAALTRSEKGSFIVSNGHSYDVRPVPVAQVVDTTGAGDMYAAGFLYGLSSGMSLPDCGHLASLTASEVIQHVGGRPQTDIASLVKKRA